jgi:hypothetical protein
LVGARHTNQKRPAASGRPGTQPAGRRQSKQAEQAGGAPPTSRLHLPTRPVRTSPCPRP